MFVNEGVIEVILVEERNVCDPGAIVPAKTPHGFKNVGEIVAQIHAVFPVQEISIRYLERNPAPGTEDDDPQLPIAFDIRELIEGDPEQAITSVKRKRLRIEEIPRNCGACRLRADEENII